MSRLTRENIDGQEVLMRDGVSLHSRRDALAEAKEWAEKQSAQLTTRTLAGPVFVLGCGAFHHIKALSQLRPELNIVGVDFDDNLLAEATDFTMVLSFRDVFKSPTRISFLIATPGYCSEADKKVLFEMGYSVLRFRPAWVGLEKEFADLETVLLDTTPESLTRWDDDGAAESLTEEQKLILALKEVVS